MSVAILGGLDRLKPLYQNSGRELGFPDLKVFGKRVPNMDKRLKGVGGIVIFTDTVSHNMVAHAVQVGKDYGIPIVRSHSSSISSLKKCLAKFSILYATVPA